MVEMIFDCPYCFNQTSFWIVPMTSYTHLETREIPPPQMSGFRNQQPKIVEYVEGQAMARCNSCRKYALVRFRTTRDVWKKMLEYAENASSLFPLRAEIVEIVPSPPCAEDLSFLPEKIARLFRDLLEIKSRMPSMRAPSLLISGCRSVLEEAVRDLGGEGRTLYDRICDLRKKGVITEPLADWAHIIRNYGNRAAHEIEATMEDAEEILEFTRVFLQLTYEIPARIREKRRP